MRMSLDWLIRITEIRGSLQRRENGRIEASIGVMSECGYKLEVTGESARTPHPCIRLRNHARRGSNSYNSNG